MLWPRRWVSASCKGLATIAAVFSLGVLLASPLPAQDRLDHSRAQDSLEQIRSAAQKRRTVRLYADLTWTMSITATEFFEDYRTLVGGKAAAFDIPMGVAIGVSSFQLGDGAIGLSAGYYKAVVRESYAYDPDQFPRPTGPPQGVTQTVTMSVLPALLTLDYFPVQRQFTGYLGAGVGLASVHLFWDEELANTSEPGARLGGVRYDESHLVPAFQGRAGVSLGFDDPLSTLTYAGIYIEAGYTYIPVSAPLFKATAETLAWAPERTAGDYNIQAGGFVLRFGFEVILSGREKRP